MTTDNERLPHWAASARTVFRAVLGLLVLLWITSFGLQAVDAFIVDLAVSDGMIAAVKVGALAVFATGAAAGLVWLAGESVSGYREPKD